MSLTCLYISDFPAWVQERVHDQRRIAVYNRERIVARSLPLRRRELEVGTPLERARQLYPHTFFYQRDPQLERVFWEDVIDKVYRLTPRLLPLEPGWLLCENAAPSVLQELADELSAQVGTAETRPAARLAALQAHPGSLLNIPPGHTNRFLKRVDIDELTLLGFESACIDQLKLFGLTTAYDAANLSRRHLEAQFEAAGGELYTFFHPETSMETIPEYQTPSTVLETFEFEHTAAEPGEMMPVLEHLVEEAVQQLDEHLCRRVSVRLYDQRHSSPVIMTRLLKEPTADLESILRGARLQLNALLKTQPAAYRLGLELGSLVHDEKRQGQLFFRRPSIKEALQTLLKRFPDKLFKPVVDNPNARLPEKTAHLTELERSRF